MASINTKAWTYTTTKGGLTSNLRLTDQPIPSHVPDHILIEVLNASLNPGDYKFPDTPVVKWLITRPASPCFDFCGRIRALPPNLPPDSRNLHIGQIVWGMHRDLKTLGTLKTIMWVHKDTVYPLPETFATVHGSALGVAALTAYQAIAPYATTPGAKVLINGATGGVGTFCIQIAKALDMDVTVTCSEAGRKICEDLGVDRILDYKSPDFLDQLRQIEKVDLVVDNVGSDPEFHRRSETFLIPDGQFVLVGLMANDWTGVRSMLASWALPAWLGGVPRKWKPIFTSSKIEDYAPVAKLAEEGKVRAVVDSVFPFSEVPKAFERLKSGRVKGKVIVSIGTEVS